MLITQVSVVACAFLYHAYYEEEEDIANALPGTANLLNETIPWNGTAIKLTEEQLTVSVGSLCGIFLVSFALFVAKIERKYVKTFFSTETGHSKAKRYFLEGEDDFIKGLILTNNRYQWTSIRPQVAEWLDANWDKWEREKPEWFNAVFIESVDDDIMPARVLARLKEEAEGGVRRRSSFMVRVSLREIEERGGGEEDAPARNDDDSEAEDKDGSENEDEL